MADDLKTGTICWNELATPDMKAAQSFYSNAFGWKFSEFKTDEFTYHMISNGANDFGGMWEISAEHRDTIPAHWMSYITVDNLAEAVAKVEKLGATIKIRSKKAGDFGQFAVIIDPTGAHVALWESFRK